MRVLVVDDCRDSADTMSLLLGAMTCRTKVAYSGATALVKAQEFKPHIIFLDLGLPEMSGIKVAEQIRTIRSLSRTRLVAYTGYSQYREEALAAGFDEYLLKPVSLGKLRELVSQVEQRIEERLTVATGTIKKIVQEKGFGFIEALGGKDVFFHHSSVANGGFDNLAQGQQVEFEVEQDGHDRSKGPRARSVTPARY